MTDGRALLRVVLIGPECTGKTWLAGRLAEHLGAPCSWEFARQFVEEHPRPVEFADVGSIGRGQRLLEDRAVAQALSRGGALVIHDTDLVSTVVYSRHYYGDCPAWIPPAAAERLAGLYLLHETDVTWAEDGHQRADAGRRVELLERFRATLSGLGARVVTVSGSWDARFETACAAIEGAIHSVDSSQ